MELIKQEDQLMNIGLKIQEARLKSKLSQQQAADELGVSRQTISNWENEKTYPDIMSVVKMSDLYDISLDRLLKEEQSMSNYLEYLDESTNVVKSKNKLSKIILISSYLVIWSLSILIFWLFTDSSDAMGYSIMYLWIILPVTTLVTSLLIGAHNFWPKAQWIIPFILGVMVMLAEYATFSAANMISFDKLNSPSFELIFIGLIISLIGLSLGKLIYKFKLKS